MKNNKKKFRKYIAGTDPYHSSEKPTLATLYIYKKQNVGPSPGIILDLLIKHYTSNHG